MVCLHWCVQASMEIDEDEEAYGSMQREGLIAGSAPPSGGKGGPKPGERRIRRIILWTGADGQQHRREVIFTDKAGVCGCLEQLCSC
jgi:hypothetical protein